MLLLERRSLLEHRERHKRKQPVPMNTLFIKCPECGKSVSTGIETDEDRVRRVPDTPVSVTCPDCGTVTQFDLRTGLMLERTYPAGF
jgi:endogenous inhibitor of DNA gyrase (YacG/DUF329 family)